MKYTALTTAITSAQAAAANEAYAKEFPLSQTKKPRSVTLLGRYFEILWDLFHDSKINDDAPIVRILQAIPNCPVATMDSEAAVALVADFRKRLGIYRKEHSQVRSQETAARRAIVKIEQTEDRISLTNARLRAAMIIRQPRSQVSNG